MPEPAKKEPRIVIVRRTKEGKEIPIGQNVPKVAGEVEKEEQKKKEAKTEDPKKSEEKKVEPKKPDGDKPTKKATETLKKFSESKLPEKSRSGGSSISEEEFKQHRESMKPAKAGMGYSRADQPSHKEWKQRSKELKPKEKEKVIEKPSVEAKHGYSGGSSISEEEFKQRRESMKPVKAGMGYSKQREPSEGEWQRRAKVKQFQVKQAAHQKKQQLARESILHTPSPTEGIGGKPHPLAERLKQVPLAIGQKISQAATALSEKIKGSKKQLTKPNTAVTEQPKLEKPVVNEPKKAKTDEKGPALVVPVSHQLQAPKPVSVSSAEKISPKKTPSLPTKGEEHMPDAFEARGWTKSMWLLKAMFELSKARRPSISSFSSKGTTPTRPSTGMKPISTESAKPARMGMRPSPQTDIVKPARPATHEGPSKASFKTQEPSVKLSDVSNRTKTGAGGDETEATSKEVQLGRAKEAITKIKGKAEQFRQKQSEVKQKQEQNKLLISKPEESTKLTIKKPIQQEGKPEDKPESKPEGKLVEGKEKKKGPLAGAAFGEGYALGSIIGQETGASRTGGTTPVTMGTQFGLQKLQQLSTPGAGGGPGYFPKMGAGGPRLVGTASTSSKSIEAGKGVRLVPNPSLPTTKGVRLVPDTIPEVKKDFGYGGKGEVESFVSKPSTLPMLTPKERSQERVDKKDREKRLKLYVDAANFPKKENVGKGLYIRCQ